MVVSQPNLFDHADIFLAAEEAPLFSKAGRRAAAGTNPRRNAIGSSDTDEDAVTKRFGRG